MVQLHQNERIDDLLTNDLKLIQSEEVFCFSLDAVLLAHFASLPKRGKFLDLCTGNGVIPILLSTRTNGHITGVDIQERLIDMAQRSVQLNGLESQIELVCGDLREIHKQLGYGTYDYITVNPPYLPPGRGKMNENPYILAARYEIYCNLNDVVAACSKLVKSGGKVAIVHRSDRLVDLIAELRAHRLEPKRMRFVHPRSDEEANMVLVEAIKDGGKEVRVLPPLIVFAEGQTYTLELQKIFGGRIARDGYEHSKKFS